MQKRGKQVLTLVFVATLLLSLTIVSAFSFSDFFSNLFGNSVTGNVASSPADCPAGLCTGLVAWYKGEESTPVTKATDSSLNGNTGIISGNLTLVSGKLGQAYDFKYNSAFASTGKIITPIAPTKTFTYSFWVKTNYINNYQSLITSKWTGTEGLLIDFFSTMLSFWSASENHASVNFGVTQLSHNTWYHIVMTREGDNLNAGYKVYLNGELKGTLASKVLTSSNPLWIGDRGDYAYQAFAGQMDEIAIWNRALSAEDVKSLYNSVNSPIISTCTDSDGGNLPYVKGFTNSSINGRAFDGCLDNNLQSNGVFDSQGNLISGGTGTKVSEGYCSSTNEYKSVILDCPNGCSNGACIPYNCSSLKLNDSYSFNMCKSNGFDNVCFNKFSAQYQGCTRNSNNDCTVNNMNSQSNILCSVSEPATCIDSDGGINIYKAGNTTKGSQIFSDFCEFSAAVKEFSCDSSGNIINTTYACDIPAGCSNGACINQTTNSITGHQVIESAKSTVNISVFTNSNTNCFYSTSDQRISNMTQFFTTGGKIHQQLFSLNSYNNLLLFVKCSGLNENAAYMINYTSTSQNITKQLTRQVISSENIKELNDISKAKLQALLQSADNGSVSIPTINIQAGTEFGVAFALRNIEAGSASSTTFHYKLKLDDPKIAENCGVSATKAMTWFMFGEGNMAITPGNTEYNRILLSLPLASPVCSTKFRILVYRPSKGETPDSPYSDSAFYLNISSSPSPKNPVCSDLISEVKYPTSTQERRTSGNDSYEGYAYVNGNEEHYTTYYASWYWNSPVYRENEVNYYYSSYDVQVFDNQNINLSDYLTWNKNNPACKTTNYWVNGQENAYYICNWDAINNRQSLDSYQSNNRQIYYYNGNVIVRMYIYYGKQLSDTEVIKLSQQKLNDLMNNLQNNEYKYIDWSNFNINYPMSNELENVFQKCKSDIQYEISGSGWNCKTEPIICPEHGYQTRVCRSWNYETKKEDTQEEKIYCSPGICSGCYVPRWFGSVDKTCIPYGFRFGQDTGKFQLFQENYTSGGLEKDTENFSIEQTLRYKGDPYVEITPDNTLILRVEGWDNVTRSLVAGDEINLLEILNLSLHYQDDLLQYLFKVDYVYYDSENYSKSYFTYTAVMETAVRNYTHSYKLPVIWNMYCDTDGEIYQQKTTDYNNNWAKCQNNYECESNLCSYGECVELKAIAGEVSGIKGLFIRMLCRLSNLFDSTDYAKCIADYGVSA